MHTPAYRLAPFSSVIGKCWTLSRQLDKACFKTRYKSNFKTSRGIEHRAVSGQRRIVPSGTLADAPHALNARGKNPARKSPRLLTFYIVITFRFYDRPGTKEKCLLDMYSNDYDDGTLMNSYIRWSKRYQPSLFSFSLPVPPFSLAFFCFRETEARRNRFYPRISLPADWPSCINEPCECVKRTSTCIATTKVRTRIQLIPNFRLYVTRLMSGSSAILVITLPPSRDRVIPGAAPTMDHSMVPVKFRNASSAALNAESNRRNAAHSPFPESMKISRFAHG